MVRIVLVVVCGVLVFVLVSKFAPHFIETYMPSASSESTETEPDAADAKSGSAQKSAKAKSGKAVRPAGASSAARVDRPVTTETSSTSTVVPRVQNAEEPVPGSVVRVTAETATLYSTNTSTGPVVGQLKKGVVVKPVFIVSSAGQEWTFVSSSDDKLAGFMRSDTLGRGRTVEAAGR